MNNVLKETTNHVPKQRTYLNRQDIYVLSKLVKLAVFQVTRIIKQKKSAPQLYNVSMQISTHPRRKPSTLFSLDVLASKIL